MIDFNPDRWQRIKEVSTAWYEKKLTRPFMGVAVAERDPGRPQPKAPRLSQATCHDFSFTPEELIDRLDYDLSVYNFYGDAFPFFNMECFGPGVAAAFLGCDLDNSTGRVWFHPPAPADITTLKLSYNPNNKYLKRIKDIYRAGMEKWQGRVIMGLVDMGGIMDILSSFFPGEALFFEMMDHPEDVKRLLSDICELWQVLYDDLQSVLLPVNPGYTDWSGIYSDKPSYIIQSDFAYMVGPDTFEEFIFPTIADHCDRLDRTVYHLDGEGQLAHLDMLLSLNKLDGIQWVPGDGKPPAVEWPEVFEKVADAGKLSYVAWSDFDGLAKIGGMVKNPGLLYLPAVYTDADHKEDALAQLARFRVER